MSSTRRASKQGTAATAPATAPATSPYESLKGIALVRALSEGAKTIDKDKIFAMHTEDPRYVTIIATVPARASPDERFSISHGAPPNLGFNVSVQVVEALREDDQFRPVENGANVDVMEVASRRQVLLRFDRNDDVTFTVSQDPLATTRTIATTGGIAPVGGSEVSLTVVYVFNEASTEEYYNTVYSMLYPRPTRGLETLSMAEVYNHTRESLSMRFMTAQTFQGIRDATRAYLNNNDFRRALLLPPEAVSEDF